MALKGLTFIFHGVSQVVGSGQDVFSYELNFTKGSGVYIV